MKLSSAIAREVLVSLAAAVAVAYIVGQTPQLRDWMREQWRGPGS